MSFEIISHRGRMENSKFQDNSLDAIKECLKIGISIEIDVTQIDEDLYLGHDDTNFKVDLSEIDFEGVYIHMKSPHIINTKKADVFFIENDSYALTKNNKIWTNYPAKNYGNSSIMCSAELVGESFNINEILHWSKKAHGVCTDFPMEVYKNLM